MSGTTMAVFSGADKKAADAHNLRVAYEIAALMTGRANRTVYLNGGSETRRHTAEYYREMAEALGIGWAYYGWCVVVGGPAGSEPRP